MEEFTLASPLSENCVDETISVENDEENPLEECDQSFGDRYEGFPYTSLEGFPYNSLEGFPCDSLDARPYTSIEGNPYNFNDDSDEDYEKIIKSVSFHENIDV